MKGLIILAAAAMIALALSQAGNKQSDLPGRLEPPETVSKAAPGQTPTLPPAYHQVLENEMMRVTQVRYEPYAQIESHDHPTLPTVYIYLSDSGPIRFIHTGDEKFTNERPPVKTGGFRLARPASETHRVESLSSQPSDFLRVELKNLIIDHTFRGRFPPQTEPAGKSSEKIGFENKQLRIIRGICASGSRCPVSIQKSPFLLVALTPLPLSVKSDNEAFISLKNEAGQIIWVEANKQLKIENQGQVPVSFLRIELKGSK